MIAKGETWELRLGDCLDPETGLASLAEKSVDHVITDPPYEAEAHTKQRRVKRGGGVMEIESLTFEAVTEDVRLGLAREAARLAKRWALVFCQVEGSIKWSDAATAAGLKYRRTGIWVKPDGMPQYTGDRPGMGYETLVCAHAEGRSKWNGGGRHGVWIFNKIGPDDFDRTGHPTQKPLALIEQLVRDFTDPGELICDPFAGSGTTGVAAIRLGRRFIGWEKDPKYHAIATKRLAAAREQLSLLEPRRKPKQESLL